MTLIGDSAAARHDVSFPACSAFEYAFASGVHGHTNCAEIQAESIRRLRPRPRRRARSAQPVDGGRRPRQPAVVAAGRVVAGRPGRAAGAGGGGGLAQPLRRRPVRLVRLRGGAGAGERARGHRRRAARWLVRRPAAAARRGRARPLRADPAYRRRYRTEPLRRSEFEVELPARRARAWTRCGGTAASARPTARSCGRRCFGGGWSATPAPTPAGYPGK